MRVALNKLACSGLEAHLGGVPAGVHAALFHYAGKLKAGRRPLTFPHFLAGLDSKPRQLEFELPIDAEIEALLKREAEANQVSLNQIVGHSVLIYLAETEFLSTSAAS